MVLTIINVPPYNSRELPEGGWALMMLSMLTSIGLISIGLTKGFAQRAAQRSDESANRR